jgi:phosphoribosylformylglycinamidine (FGAM) synthase PurS component
MSEEEKKTKEKFTVRVIRKRKVKNTEGNAIEEIDQIYEQEFDHIDIGDFAMKLNRKDGQEKDEKSIKMTEEEILKKEIKDEDFQMTEKGVGN